MFVVTSLFYWQCCISLESYQSKIERVSNGGSHRSCEEGSGCLLPCRHNSIVPLLEYVHNLKKGSHSEWSVGHLPHDGRIQSSVESPNPILSFDSLDQLDEAGVPASLAF